MSVAELNGVPVVAGTIRLPRTGWWVADLAVDQAQAITGPATIDLDGGRLQLQGTAKRSGLSAETAVVRVLPGGGKLATPLAPKFYRKISARVVAGDILGAAGDQLSSSSDAGILGRQLDAFCQPAWPAADALSHLCAHLGAIWRSLPDGTVWIGTEIWPSAAAPGEVLRQLPHAAREVWGVDGCALLPGTVIAGRKVSTVVHRIEAGELRTETWYEADGVGNNEQDRQTRALMALIRQATAPLDFFALYRAKVVAQDADLALELQPQDARLPGMTKVPIRPGLAGSTTKLAVPIRAQALLTFEDGDPESPVVVGWESADVGETTIAVGAGGKIHLTAGLGGQINAEVGLGGVVNLGGAGGLPIALHGDVAGYFPITAAKCLTVKAKVGP